jgi:drug/metabolite transporter (DMT)-like permease
VPIHLLLPFCSSVLVVFGLLCLQRAQNRGVSTWTSMILVCWSSACVFPVLTLMGGTLQPAGLLWQPAVIGGLFLGGQLLMFLAVARGDVSIAAPVLGVKVLIVPAASGFLVEQELPVRVWVAATIAVAGIAFVQTRDATVDRSRIAASVGYALLGACAMTLFDLLIQRWAPAWGAGYFLPIAFACAALSSLAFVPLADRPSELKRLGVLQPLAWGSLLMAVQAIGMTLTLGLFGDATRVNIVYSLRGLWGVVLTWVFARHVSAAGLGPGHRTMVMRLIGAALIGLSVVISVT